MARSNWSNKIEHDLMPGGTGVPANSAMDLSYRRSDNQSMHRKGSQNKQLKLVAYGSCVPSYNNSLMLSQLQPPLSDVFNFKAFRAYLMTEVGGSNDRVTAKSIAHDLTDFFHATSKSSQQHMINKLLNRSNLELFVDHIKHKTTYTPTVIAAKMESLKLAIQFIISYNKDYCNGGRSLLRLLTDLQQSKAISKSSMYDDSILIQSSTSTDDVAHIGVQTSTASITSDTGALAIITSMYDDSIQSSTSCTDDVDHTRVQTSTKSITSDTGALATIKSVYDDSIHSNTSTDDVDHIRVQTSTESITPDTSSAEMQSSAYSSDDSNSDTDSCSCTSNESECDEWTDVDNDRMPVFTYCNSSIDNNMDDDATHPTRLLESYKFNFSGFAKYLVGIAGGNRNKDAAKAIVRDVELFFQLTPSTPDSDIDKLFNKANLERFFQKLLNERHYKPTTISEKIRRMKLAIKYVIHAEDSMLSNRDLFIKGSRLLELLTQWCLSLSKAIALQRQQHSLTTAEKIPLLLDAQEFLENEKVQHRVKVARNILNDGMFDKPAAKILTAYAAACILYGNSQRSGVITNLRIIEFNGRQPCDCDSDEVIIPCLHHKTGPQGIAHLVVTRDIEQILVEYYNHVRKQIRAIEFTNSNRFFLTTNGSLYTQVYRRIKEALSIGRLKPPRPKEYRILVATDAARELDDADLRRVARHLCHSTETSRQYYQFTNTNDSMLAHQAIRNLSERRKWSRQHIKALLKEWPLKKSPPGLAVCREISNKHKLDRTGKQVLDKWRQLKKM